MVPNSPRHYFGTIAEVSQVRSVRTLYDVRVRLSQLAFRKTAATAYINREH